MQIPKYILPLHLGPNLVSEPCAMTLQEIETLRKKYYNATVSQIIECDEGLWRIRIKPDGPMQAFHPGQYTTIGLGTWEPRHPKAQPEPPNPANEGKLLRRAYSMSHPMLDDETHHLIAPEKVDYYEFYITLVLQGDDPKKPPAFTPRLFSTQEGDRISFGPKITGHYTLESVDLAKTPTLFFFATGTGEAPHNAMIWHLLSKGYCGQIVSAVTTRHKTEQAYRSVHETLIQKFPNYHYIPIATRDGGPKVYIQDLITQGVLEKDYPVKIDPQTAHVFLCGNPAMITGDKGVVKVLEGRGFTVYGVKNPQGQIHFESYW